jgi:ribosome-binding factor A
MRLDDRLCDRKMESGARPGRTELMKRSGIRRGPRTPSQRQLRVGELIRHTLAEILQHGAVHDPALEGVVVTVPEVRLTPDLRVATVFVMPLGGKNADTIVAAFDRNKRFLRGEIAHRIDLRHAPELVFRLDTSFDEGDRIDALLRSPAVSRDLGVNED